MNGQRRQAAIRLLQYVPLAIFGAIVLVFSMWTDRFFQLQNFINIVEQTTPVAIVAVGMTFVLLTAGIDLAVGSTMYLSVVMFGYFLPSAGPWTALSVAMATGALLGLVHGIWTAWLRVAPFIVTLSTLFVIRGIGRGITQTKGIRFNEAVTQLNRTTYLGIPWAIWVLLVLVLVGSFVLRRTGLGRQIYAIGQDENAAMKAGIRVRPILVFVYVVCGACAAIAGLVSATQQSSAQPTFAEGMEFAAIAAAVLGGTSLFGGRGGILGAVFGALLIKTLHNGLNIVNANPFVYPLVIGAFIFLAVMLDSSREQLIWQLNRRLIIPTSEPRSMPE